MQAIYPYFLTIHLICAIIFLGFIFTDVVLLSRVKKVLGEELGQKLIQVVTQRGVKIMPLCVLLLVLSGGAMISRYISFESFWDSPLQKLLMIKLCLALLIVILVLNALFHKLILKKPNPIGAYTHIIVFVLGFGIVVLAKLAFFVN
ncbi:copper resistance protein CopD [Campylobacter sp. MIT 99-7217]|uniref:copper resistance protein CopD n=1 Tax=Campylobacter sp. MIT 99-7217 TaxID=535091 RepID=UPI00115B0910|nr:copper resistance protein CopD [Campylobacter sp. MIT 99-7217]TQR34542.1 copper resistance protein CopD [Campylobacter sp. MIT 99-7217]